MRVLILSQYYHPEGVPKPNELAEALQASGHEVSVLTGLPHYPGGRLMSGYKLGLLKRERVRDVPVTRVFEFPYHGTNPLLRITNYLSFMLSAPLAAFLLGKTDVMYVWHPPLTVGIAAWLVARLKGIPFVYDVQDIWPDFVILSGMMRENSLTVRLLRSLERFVYRRATHLIVGTAAARENLILKNVPPEKITILPNWIDETAFAPLDGDQRETVRGEFGWTGQFVILFAGNLGIVQGLETVINAAKELGTGKNARIVLMGDGTDKARLQEIARAANVGERLQFIERQPFERMPDLMAAADVLLVHLKRSELSRYVIPSKTMAYLASGKPILMAMNGAAADLIETARAGIVVEPEDATALAAAVARLQQMNPAEQRQLGANGREYLIKHLAQEKVIASYEQLLQRVADEWKRTKKR